MHEFVYTWRRDSGQKDSERVAMTNS